MKNKIAIITHSQAGEKLAQTILKAGWKAEWIPKEQNAVTETLMKEYDALLFIGSLGICVRCIAPFLKSKKNDPAILNADVNGHFVQPVVSGHLGGANELAKDLSRLIGAQPVLTTVSDSTDLWALDLLPARYGWKMEYDGKLSRLTGLFVNRKPTALLLEARDTGTLFLENSHPEHVTVFYEAEAINPDGFDLIVAVTPRCYDWGDKVIWYRPAMIDLGIGCQKGMLADALKKEVEKTLGENKIALKAVRCIGSAELKKEEPALNQLADEWKVPFCTFDKDTLNGYEVPNPSDKVNEVTGAASVAEAAAMHLSGSRLLMNKTKLKAGAKFATVAAAVHGNLERKGFIEIVGAGPGDPLLVTVRGKLLLQTADLILYAGSLVPKELTNYAKPGCVVRSSASLDLQEQFEIMQTFYRRRLLVVRLHTGDPCIYGAIQEQMNLMDGAGMRYRITPGVSSFQAAAATLQSQFTIPEEVQTIILTRGEGRTAMPEREKLSLLARSQSTMCIYLSATIAGKVQHDLLEHYPPSTPVAVCFKLTWKEEKIYRCTLETLEKTVKENHLTMTTLIVVGKAIDNRSGESRLYHKNFKHTFRK